MITKKQRGFTIVETVLVIGLIVVCGLVIANLFIGQNRIYRVQTAELNVTGDARRALDDIDNYTREATRTLSNYSTYTAGSTVLILQLRSISVSNQILAGYYDVVVYYLDGTKLYRRVMPDVNSSRVSETKQLASSINSLSFTYNNISYPSVTEVTTSLTAQENAGVQSRAITVSSKSALRNY